MTTLNRTASSGSLRKTLQAGEDGSPQENFKKMMRIAKRRMNKIEVYWSCSAMEENLRNLWMWLSKKPMRLVQIIASCYGKNGY
jgi:hypothetical protein